MCILDHGMINFKAKEHTFIEVERDIKDYSIKVKKMGKGYIGI